jgi:hypothetical protein
MANTLNNEIDVNPNINTLSIWSVFTDRIADIGNNMSKYLIGENGKLHIHDFRFLEDRENGEYKAFYSHKETGNKWIITKDFNYESAISYITGDLYRLLLGEDRAPNIQLIQTFLGNWVMGSEFIPKFTSLYPAIGEKQWSEFKECFPSFCQFEKFENIKIKEIIGVEEIFAALMLLGESDAQSFNLGVIPISEEGKFALAKIDHDRSLSSAKVCTESPGRTQASYGSEESLYHMAETVFSKRAYNYSALDLIELSNAFEKFAHIPADLWENTIKAKVTQLIEKGLITEYKLYLRGDGTGGIAKMENSLVTVLSERLKLAEHYAKSLKVEAARRSQNDEQLIKLIANKIIDINTNYDSIAWDKPATIVEMAVHYNNHDQLNYFLSLKPAPTTIVNAVKLAVIENKSEMLDTFLALELDLSPYKELLLTAIIHKNQQLIDYFIAHEFDISRDKDSILAAVQHKNQQLLNYFLSEKSELLKDEDVITTAVKSNNQAALDTFATVGIKVTDKPELFKIAIDSDNKAVIKAFVDAGLVPMSQQEVFDNFKNVFHSFAHTQSYADLITDETLAFEACKYVLSKNDYYDISTLASKIHNNEQLFEILSLLPIDDSTNLIAFLKQISDSSYLDKYLLHTLDHGSFRSHLSSSNKYDDILKRFESRKAELSQDVLNKALIKHDNPFEKKLLLDLGADVNLLSGMNANDSYGCIKNLKLYDSQETALIGKLNIAFYLAGEANKGYICHYNFPKEVTLESKSSHKFYKIDLTKSDAEVEVLHSYISEQASIIEH